MNGDAVSNVITDGLNAETIGSLLLFVLVLYLLFELRRLVQHLSRWKRVRDSHRIRVGDYVQIDGNNGISNWRIEAIDWSGVWLHSVDDSTRKRWEPHEAFLTQARVFIRNGAQPSQSIRS